MKRTCERPARGPAELAVHRIRIATKPPVSAGQCTGSTPDIAAAAPLDEQELAAWMAALDHLAATGFPGIAPREVASALAERGPRRHLAVVR